MLICTYRTKKKTQKQNSSIEKFLINVFFPWSDDRRLSGGWYWKDPWVSYFEDGSTGPRGCRSPPRPSCLVQCVPSVCELCGFSACSSRSPTVRPDGKNSQCFGTKHCRNSDKGLLACILLEARMHQASSSSIAMCLSRAHKYDSFLWAENTFFCSFLDDMNLVSF